MTILLYDYCELEERTSQNLRIWKAWHIILYALAAVFGILNYAFLQSTMQLVNNNCVLYPRKFEFHMVKISNTTDNKGIATNTSNYTLNIPTSNENVTNISPIRESENITEDNAHVTSETVPSENRTINEDETGITKREAVLNGNATDEFESTITVNNVTVVIGNRTHHLMLDTSGSLFGRDNDCQFAEYMPIVSTIFAAVWLTFFIMCPGGGRSRSGLKQPWVILTPALLFALVMVGLTGHSFARTNGGLQAFCSAFFNVTNATTCSSASPFVESARNVSWGVGPRAAATRAASAGAWAAWACACALLLARCLAAPDFVVRRTGVYLKDPQGKLTPYLKKSPRRSLRSMQSSPSKRDNASIRSEPTITTELVTASVEHDDDSAPTSLTVTPKRHGQRSDLIEMTYNPGENSRTKFDG